MSRKHQHQAPHQQRKQTSYHSIQLENQALRNRINLLARTVRQQQVDLEVLKQTQQKVGAA